MYNDLISLVIKDVGRRKFSSFLTFFAISLGIFSIFLIILLSLGFENSIKAEFEELGTNRLYISAIGSNFGSSQSGISLVEDDVNYIVNRPYIQEAYPYLMENLQIQYGNNFERTMIVGTYFSEDFFRDLNLEIDQGRFPRNNEQSSVVIGSLVAEDLFNRKIPVGGNIYISDIKFRVIGILEEVGSPQDDSMIVLNIDSLREITGDTQEKVDVVYALVDEGYDVDLAKENLQLSLDNRLGEDRVNVQTQAQLLSQFESILGIVQGTLGGIALVSLLVGAFGIINTMYVIVTEKTKDIGIMKSVGARNRDILFMYVFMAGFFGFVGAVLGVIFGSLGAIAFEAVAQQTGYTFLEISIDPVAVVSLLVFGFVIGIISGYLPARKASKITIIDTLRK